MPNEAREIRHGAPLTRAQGNSGRVEGVAVVFDEWTSIGGYFEERVAPGALDGRLSDDVVFLLNHAGMPLARTASGTLELEITPRGLVARTTLDPSAPLAADVLSAIGRGDLAAMSFAFTVAREEWDETGDTPRRTILEVGRLYDVSVVTEPAYPTTEIGLRSLQAARAARAPRDLAGLVRRRAAARLALHRLG